jgi:16S rRNA G966 N2-methylase RsmD
MELATTLRPITKEQALKDYEALQRDTPVKPLQGLKAVDYFTFAQRLQTKGNKGISFPEYIASHNYETVHYESRLYKQKLLKLPPLKAQYELFQLYYGSINSFKPSVAKSIYMKYKPTTVLDVSAGWGGRALAAMATNTNYIGFDTNQSLAPSYKGMKETYKHTSEVHFYIQDSATVDFSQYDYDCVFTSPPYYRKYVINETYEHMPDYKSQANFNERFLVPVVTNSYKYMKPGYYILNIPATMYEDVRTILGEATEILPLPFVQRKRAIETVVYNEYMYVWKKPRLNE